MKIKNRAMRTTAALLAMALIHGTFGPEAWAQLVPRVGAVEAPVGNVGAAGVNGSLNAAASFSAAPALTSFSLGAAPSLNAPAAPVFHAASVQAAPALNAAAAPLAAASIAHGAPIAAPSATPAAAPALTPSFSAAATPENEDAASAPISASAPAETVKAASTGRLGGVGARVSQRIAELKAFFSNRRAQTLDAGAAASVPAGDDKSASNGLKPAAPSETAAATPAVPAPQAPQGASAERKRSINWFLGGMLVAQVGVEVLGLAMPLLMRQKFGGFSALAQIAVFSSVASIFGQLSGGPIASKLGIKATFIGATILRLLSISAMVVFLMGPHAPLIAAIAPLAKLSAFLNGFSARAVLMGFYSFNGFMAGVAGTAQKSIPTAILGNDRATLEKFYSLQQWLLEIIGVSGPKAGGVMVQAFGFTSAIAVYPVMLTIAVAMYLFGVRVPNDGEAQSEAAAKPKSKFAAMLAPLAPMNRAIAGVFNKVTGAITKFVDGLVLKAYLGRWIKELGGKGHLTDADEHALLTRSTLGWTTAGMISLAGFATLLLPTALPAYAAMVVFGVAEVIASQKLYSLILSRTQGKAETVKVNAVAGGLFTAASALALNLTGMLFDKTSGMVPFTLFLGALVPLAAAVYFIRRQLKKTDEAGAPAPAERPSGYKLLFKDKMMLWAFLGYVALGVTNPLLYQILSQAYGLLHAGGNAALASGVASWITALYSFGGLLGALYMWRESTLIGDAKKPAEAPAK